MAKRRRKRKLKFGNIFITLGLIVLFILVGIYGKKTLFKTDVDDSKSLLKDLVEKSLIIVYKLNYYVG